MAQHDLFPTFAKFLDPQLAFALLEYAAARGIYDERDVTEARITLLHGTNMVEYEVQLNQELHNTTEVPQALEERRSQVIEKLTAVQERANPIMQVCHSLAVQPPASCAAATAGNGSRRASQQR